MQKKHSDFDVVVASFEAFLKEKFIHYAYFQEWKKEKNYQGTADLFYAWREWAKYTKPKAWIIGAFEWQNTKKGYELWSVMNYEWVNWYNQNLKK